MQMSYHLSLGAHLLLWVFPLILAATVVVQSILEARREHRP